MLSRFLRAVSRAVSAAARALTEAFETVARAVVGVTLVLLLGRAAKVHA